MFGMLRDKVKPVHWVSACLIVQQLIFGSTIPLVCAGTYVFAGKANGVNLVTHPKGYTGAGGPRVVTVCLDPTSDPTVLTPANQAAIETSIRNVVHTYNRLKVTTGNLIFGAANNIPAGAYDFESVILHETGHCLGLGHPNLASESGQVGANQNYTKSTTGVNGFYNLNPGIDGVIGSNDDVRGDDVNLHWFFKRVNNPFILSNTKIDATTYTRNVAFLPATNNYVANGDRTVAKLMGYPNTEAVMQQGQFADEAQRSLTADDVATLRYAMSGLDATQGTRDDYTISLAYVGKTAACDIPIKIVPGTATFAFCQTRATFLVPGQHAAITNEFINVGGGWNWFFNSVPNAKVPDDFNGDGTSDLLWRHGSGMNAVWLMANGTKAGGGLIPSAPVGWKVAGIGDFNGDGKADVLWRHKNGMNAIWLMSGLTKIGGGLIPFVPPAWKVVGVGDVNGDGKADIVWRNPANGMYVVWMMNGVTRVSASVGGSPASWSVVGLGDFNGDGLEDVLWRHASGMNAVWLMGPAGPVVKKVIPSAPAGWSVAGIGDFNGDGKADIFWRNGNGLNVAWYMNSTAKIGGGVMPSVALAWTAAKVGDYNGDGKADVLWRNAVGFNVIWLMNGVKRMGGGPIPSAPAGWQVQ